MDRQTNKSVHPGGGDDAILTLKEAVDGADAARLLEESLGESRTYRSAIHGRKKPGKVIASFTYVGEDGKPVAKVNRLEPGFDGATKSFLPYLFDPSKGCYDEKAGLNGKKLPLYHLDEVLAAIATQQIIFFVEGEGKCDRLRAALRESGSRAAVTTIAGGANAPVTNQHVKALEGATSVTFLADSDIPGDGAATERAQGVVNAFPNCTVKIVDLFPARDDGSDITDLLDEGHTLDELYGLIKAAPAPVVETPTPPIALSELFQKIRDIIHRFVSLGENEAIAIALWIMMTYALAAFDCVAYLSITSAEKQSGKSRLLETLELLVARPWLTGRCTPAVLARKIDAESPTLLLDESDATFNGNKEFAEVLRGFLNTGYSRSGKVSLCVAKGKEFELRDFSTFGPKAIAGIGSLPDTVADRSIPIRLTRKLASEKIDRFRRKHVQPQADAIRQEIDTWAKTFTAEEHPEPAGLNDLPDRAADICEPLLQIAEACGENVAMMARHALAWLCGHDREDESLGIKVLSDIRAIFDENSEERITSASLASNLAAIEESPWGPQRGRDFAARELARLLRPYGIRPKTIRLENGTAKGYHRQDFEDAWTRFLPSITEKTVTTVTGVTSHRKDAFSQPPAVTTAPHEPPPPSQTRSMGKSEDEPVADIVPSQTLEASQETSRKMRDVTDVTDVTLKKDGGQPRPRLKAIEIKPGAYNGGRLQPIQAEGGKVYRKTEPHPFIAKEGGPGTRCELCRKPWASHGKPPRSQWLAIPAKVKKDRICDDLLTHSKQKASPTPQPLSGHQTEAARMRDSREPCT